MWLTAYHKKLVGDWTVKLDRFPRDRGENKTRLSCHHLKKYMKLEITDTNGNIPLFFTKKNGLTSLKT